MGIINEADTFSWNDIKDEKSLKEKITFWLNRLLSFFPEEHELILGLKSITFEPENTDRRLYSIKKEKKLKENKEKLTLLFNKLPQYYNQLPLFNQPLEELLEHNEGQYLEFKPSLTRGINKPGQSIKSGPDRIMVAIASFLNTNGGVLLIGVKDDGSVDRGINNDYGELDNFLPPGHIIDPQRNPNGYFQKNEDGFENCFTHLLARYFDSAIIVDKVDIKFDTKNGKDVCIVSVKKSNKPVLFQGKRFYVRRNNTNKILEKTPEIVDYVYDHFCK